ncbi:hypothetical protein AN221_05890 [Streptomyces nanshensis]|uniref:Uncharacterized protein n=1 Tax=Streptomyces nanshensis TaxID=518642 RepID=A0A1E7LYT8_9ACTN|nr:hypothetical protein AN221_05890 [Streptomyces nanshensis]
MPAASRAGAPSPERARAQRRAPATCGSLSASTASTRASTGTGTSSAEERAARWRASALVDPSAWRSVTIWRASSQSAGPAAWIPRSRVSSSVSASMRVRVRRIRSSTSADGVKSPSSRARLTSRSESPSARRLSMWKIRRMSCGAYSR